MERRGYGGFRGGRQGGAWAGSSGSQLYRGTKLYVGGLPQDFQCQDLFDLFSTVGEVVECTMLNGYGFIVLISLHLIRFGSPIKFLIRMQNFPLVCSIIRHPKKRKERLSCWIIINWSAALTSTSRFEFSLSFFISQYWPHWDFRGPDIVRCFYWIWLNDINAFSIKFDAGQCWTLFPHMQWFAISFQRWSFSLCIFTGKHLVWGGNSRLLSHR